MDIAGIMANHMAGGAKNESGKTETISFNKDTPIQHSAKDPASLGKEELGKVNIQGQHPDYQRVIDLYTTAITTSPQAPSYYINRSIGYLRVKPPRLTEALSDAEIGVVLAYKRNVLETILEAQLQRAKVLSRLERYGDAVQCFDWGLQKIKEDYKPNDKYLQGMLNGSRTLRDFAQKEVDNSKGDVSKVQVTVKEVPGTDADDLGKGLRGKSITSANGHTTAREIPVSKGDQAEKKPEGMQTPADKIRHEWFQNQQNVTINLLAKGIPQDKATVDIQPYSLTISFPLSTGSDFDFSLDPLYAEIDPKASTYKITSSKVECTLKKVIAGLKWRSSESTGPSSSAQDGTSTATVEAVKRANLSPLVNATASVYPTSSRTGPKNWDKLADDLTKRPAKKAESSAAATDDSAKAKSEAVDAEDWIDDEGGDQATSFFKKLFQNADPDTRRAMMKSYQESNGTALSTNWDEVGKKKMETSPPDGMVAKKWGE